MEGKIANLREIEQGRGRGKKQSCLYLTHVSITVLLSTHVEKQFNKVPIT